MTVKQRLVVLCGTFVFILMGLFPPWLAVETRAHSERYFVGYRFIMHYVAEMGEYGFTHQRYNHEIFMSVLLIQWVSVLSLTLVVYKMCGRLGGVIVKWNTDGKFYRTIANEYIYFLKSIVIGILAFLFLPVIRFAYHWYGADYFNWSNFDIIGNLKNYYSSAWFVIFIPYVLTIFFRLLLLFSKSIKWALRESR